jgi:transposase
VVLRNEPIDPEQQTMQSVAVYVGLDYHSESIQVCVMDENGQTLRNRRMANEVGDVVECVRNAGGRDEVLIVRGVAIEACCGAADFATALEAATEWTVKLAHAGAVRRLKADRDKTDRGDAWHLANLLRGGYLPVVWLADDVTRQLRRLVRHRQGLMAEAKTIKLRIRSVLKEERVPETCSASAWTQTWRKWLAAAPLGEHARWVIDRSLDLLARFDEELRAVDERLEAATQDDPVVQQLRQQPGVGPVTAHLLRAVIGRFDRFRTGKQLAKYCGLSPCNASSGKKQADAGLIAAGHDDLRAVLIQLAKRLPRHEPRWRELHAQLRKTKPANVASAAIANRWVRRLHYELTKTPRAPVA